jgi:membrane protein DedA with SNARE-associated domain
MIIFYSVYFVVVMGLAITSIVLFLKARKQNKAIMKKLKEIFEEYKNEIKRINDKYGIK